VDGATIGIVGGVAGTLIGVAGGVVGTWASVHATRTPEERRFVSRVAVVLWVALGVLLGIPLALVLLGVLPFWLTWIPMTTAFVALGPCIRWANARQATLRGDPGLPPGASHPTPH
jgi:MFS family permease